MKNICACFLLLGVFNCFAQFPYPDYTRVHREFYSKFDETIKGQQMYTGFEKRIDGWYVQYTTPEDYTNKKRFQLWDKKTNKWLETGFDKTTTTYEPFDEARVPYMYRVSPMYGYGGWYKDVIDSLGNKEKLSDTLLYALSKAYFNHLAAAFGNQYGDYIKEDVLAGETVPNTFSEDDLVEVRRRYTKVQETNKRIQQQNNSFETFIGSLSMQYSNDVMDVFMRMYLYQNKEEAFKYLEPDLYDPYILDFAKYLLFSCPPNAILFTNGDNDTYPLWYAQYMLGIRTDVAVVNSSLLNYPSYASMVRKYKIVDFLTKEENLFKPGFEYALIKDREKKMNSKDLVNFSNQEFEGTEPKNLEGGTFIFNIYNKDYEVKTRSYIYCGNLVMMDMIYLNVDKRPICFTSGADIFSGLIDPDMEVAQIKTAGWLANEHALQLLKIWEGDFLLSDYSTFNNHFSEQHERAVGFMIYDIGLKTKYLVKEGKLKEAKQIAMKLNSTFSAKLVKRNRMWLDIAAILGKTGESKMAGEMVDDMIRTEKKQLQLEKNSDDAMIKFLETNKAAIVNGSYLNM